jgi:hypothetical protein
VELRHATFAEHVGDRFRGEPSLGGEPVDLILTACEPSPHAAGREAFSLIFHAPGPGHLPQQTFTLAHEALGAVDLFLVPLGPEGQAMVYEAVINAAP